MARPVGPDGRPRLAALRSGWGRSDRVADRRLAGPDSGVRLRGPSALAPGANRPASPATRGRRRGARYRRSGLAACAGPGQLADDRAIRWAFVRFRPRGLRDVVVVAI